MLIRHHHRRQAGGVRCKTSLFVKPVARAFSLSAPSAVVLRERRRRVLHATTQDWPAHAGASGETVISVHSGRLIKCAFRSAGLEIQSDYFDFEIINNRSDRALQGYWTEIALDHGSVRWCHSRTGGAACIDQSSDSECGILIMVSQRYVKKESRKFFNDLRFDWVISLRRLQKLW